MQSEACAAHLLVLAPASCWVLVQEACLEHRRLCLSPCISGSAGSCTGLVLLWHCRYTSSASFKVCGCLEMPVLA